MTTNSKGAQRVAAAERRRQILQLRRSGLTLDLIGRAMGISRQRVHAILKPELARTAAGNAADAKLLRA